jgi:Protein of unknown function (DUF1616)
MYRRNLDIFVAGGLALLGGAAYEAHVPGPVQVVLGIALFFAPGYLWSEAILSQRLTGVERVLTSAGLSLILPILGGFLFYGLRIPLFRSAWVGLLVVLTLLGVVAVAVQRLRQPPVDTRQVPGNAPQGPRSRIAGWQIVVYGLAAVIGIGSVAFSVKSADAQKFPGDTILSMTAQPPQMKAPASVNLVVPEGDPTQPNVVPNSNATQANLVVENHEGVAETYTLNLMKNGKLEKTWSIALANGQTWQTVITYTTTSYTLQANLYLLPNLIKPIDYVTNGEGNTQLYMTPGKNKYDRGTAYLGVANEEGVTKQYRVELLKNGKVAKTWNFTLKQGQSWQSTVAYTKNETVADLYLLPNVSQPYATANGVKAG